MKTLGLSANGLNYSKFSQKHVKDREWIETRFYIGQLKQGQSQKSQKLYAGQRKFLLMLENQKKVKIFLGRMEHHAAKNTANGLDIWLDNLPKSKEREAVPSWAKQELRNIADKEISVWTEKAVDVNIAIDMVSMAHEDEYDVAYLLSADGDFTPAVQRVRDIGKKVFVLSPALGNELAQVADIFIPLQKENFHDCWDHEG